MSLPINIVGQSYADESLPWAAQETINLYPVIAETDGTRSVAMLKGTPGLEAFGQIGNGAFRGALVMGGVLYVVADTTLYSVASDGTGTSLGTITGSGRVGMAENGNQLIIVNGTAGWTYTASTATFAQITDPDYPGSVDVVFIGQYMAHVTGDDDEWFISALNDATDYDALDFAFAESAPDGLKGLLPLNRELWLFGDKTTEVWQNTGAADFPFERTTTIERGIASTFAKAKLDNTIYWLGENGIVYRANGYTPERVSTGPIEQAIATETLSEAFAFAYETQGHAFFVLSFPNGKTWVYDVASRAWHRRKSYELDRWRANVYVFAYNKHLVGDFAEGQLWEMLPTVYTEGDDPLVAERKTQYFHRDGDRFSVGELELYLNPGHGVTTGQGSDPIVDLAYSKDGGRTFSNFRQLRIGKIGEYERRVRTHRLGQFRHGVMLWLRISDPVNRDIIAASAN